MNFNLYFLILLRGAYVYSSTLTIITGKNCVFLNSVQIFTKIQGWLLLTFFICLHNQLSSIHSISHINKEYRCLNKIFHQNRQKKLLQQNLGWFLFWHRKTLCLRGFILKPRGRAWILLKMILGIFKIALFERSTCFYVTTTGNFECFPYFIFDADFLKDKNLFQKTGVLFFSTKIESAIFPHKTALPEANVKTNRMRSTKWTYHKGQSFATNYFSFLKILFQSKNLFWSVD